MQMYAMKDYHHITKVKQQEKKCTGRDICAKQAESSTRLMQSGKQKNVEGKDKDE